MDTRVKGLWTDALRSGEYEQAKEMLAKVDPETGKVEGFCCLGVLCDLAVKEGVIPEPVLSNRLDNKGLGAPANADDWPKDRLLYGVGDGVFDTSSADLPEAVRVWADLYDRSPSVEAPNPDYDPDEVALDEYDEPETASYGLAELNDDQGKNFSEIADLIESDL